MTVDLRAISGKTARLGSVTHLGSRPIPITSTSCSMDKILNPKPMYLLPEDILGNRIAYLWVIPDSVLGKPEFVRLLNGIQAIGKQRLSCTACGQMARRLAKYANEDGPLVQMFGQADERLRVKYLQLHQQFAQSGAHYEVEFITKASHAWMNNPKAGFDGERPFWVHHHLPTFQQTTQITNTPAEGWISSMNPEEYLATLKAFFHYNMPLVVDQVSDLLNGGESLEILSSGIDIILNIIRNPAKMGGVPYTEEYAKPAAWLRDVLQMAARGGQYEKGWNTKAKTRVALHAMFTSPMSEGETKGAPVHVMWSKTSLIWKWLRYAKDPSQIRRMMAHDCDPDVKGKKTAKPTEHQARVAAETLVKELGDDFRPKATMHTVQSAKDAGVPVYDIGANALRHKKALEVYREACAEYHAAMVKWEREDKPFHTSDDVMNGIMSAAAKRSAEKRNQRRGGDMFRDTKYSGGAASLVENARPRTPKPIEPELPQLFTGKAMGLETFTDILRNIENGNITQLRTYRQDSEFERTYACHYNLPYHMLQTSIGGKSFGWNFCRQKDYFGSGLVVNKIAAWSVCEANRQVFILIPESDTRLYKSYVLSNVVESNALHHEFLTTKYQRSLGTLMSEVNKKTSVEKPAYGELCLGYGGNISDGKTHRTLAQPLEIQVNGYSTRIHITKY